MTSYITSAIQSFSKKPISDSIYSGVSSLASRAVGAYENLSSIPLGVLAYEGTLGIATVGLGYAAYKLGRSAYYDNSKSKSAYGSAALLALSSATLTSVLAYHTHKFYIYYKADPIKVLTYLPLRTLGTVASVAALFNLSIALGRRAYNSNNTRSKVLYGTSAVLSASLGAFEFLKGFNAMQCFNKSFDCSGIFLTPDQQACAEKAQAAYNSCISLI